MELAKNPVSYGTSLLVPSVLELAKQKIESIPPRYVQLQDASAGIPPCKDDASQAGIPVIDLEKLHRQESMVSELEKLHLACRDWGFFQLVNHGVSPSLTEKMKSEVVQFFGMPMEEKKRYWQQPGEVEGFGQAFVISEEQKLDWSDIFFLTTLPLELRKPHLFDVLPTSFRETMHSYSAKLEEVATECLALVAKAVGVAQEDMAEVFQGGLQAMRMNYYPPCPRPDQVIGLTPHSDAVGLTLLLQVNDKEGLQIRKDGEWVPVKPLPDAFIVNIGDILEIVTNGIYRSIEHRAVVNSAKERLSIATFHSPRVTAEWGPAPSLINAEKPAKFRRTGTEDYFRGLFSRKLDGKSYIDVMRIENTI